MFERWIDWTYRRARANARTQLHTYTPHTLTHTRARARTHAHTHTHTHTHAHEVRLAVEKFSTIILRSSLVKTTQPVRFPCQVRFAAEKYPTILPVLTTHGVCFVFTFSFYLSFSFL